MPHRDRYLFVCTNRRPDGDPKGSCAERGAEEIVKRLKSKLAEAGLAKTVARACSTSCIDQCPTGVAIVQEPEHVAYGHVTLADVDDLVAAVATGGVVERLRVYPARTDSQQEREPK
ncbi:MAG: (2Fe-2S) ferredoxin domain-containing protein [Polyangiaceae bacterium]|nr:(2Fe-2S) ferredoxin domain-containing protein [Polyangiaceae bacterium]